MRIVSSNTAMGPTDNLGSGIDVVAMDDFLYAEPRAVPEAAGLTPVGMGALALGLLSWRRRSAA